MGTWDLKVANSMKFSAKNHRSGEEAATFAKSLPSFAKFMKISLEFGQNLSEFVPMFPFSYHSFQTDPQAGISRNPK